MLWQVEYTNEFGGWWDSLSEAQQEAIAAAVGILEDFGPGLGRPLVDQISGSRYQHMKELRISKGGALRILFAFDPRRMAILLVGGDKSGRWERWYTEAIPLADTLYEQHLRELRDEGLI